jgi:2-desacetyl-2-hydroxyethyl bacteriochlorophyllide A dehydrogenase
MQALVYTAPRAVEWREWRDPEPGRGEVLVRVHAAALCGSDLHGFLGHSKIRVPPMVMGHEFTGEIVALGDDVRDLAPGDRVVVQPLVTCGECMSCRAGRTSICPRRRLLGGHLQGAFAEHIAAPASLVYRLPDHVDFAAGALTEPLANGVHMARLAPPAYQDVVVFGTGTLGMMALQAFRAAGARRVVVVDTAAPRLEVAARLGADATLNPRLEDVQRGVHAALQGEPPAIAVDAVGHTVTRQQALALVAPGGTVVLLGLAEPSSEFDVLSAINREVRLQGSYGSDDADFRAALALIADRRVDVTSWVEHFSPDQGQDVFTRLVDDPRDLVKAIFMLGQ